MAVRCRSPLRRCLQAVQEHHESEPVRYEVSVPERAPYRALGARGPDGDVRVLSLVLLKPRDLIRRAGRDLVHAPVWQSARRSAQGFNQNGPLPAPVLWLGPAPALSLAVLCSERLLRVKRAGVKDAPADELLGEIRGRLVVEDRERAKVLVTY